jgi:gamma-glutamylcysteine synthetase
MKIKRTLQILLDFFRSERQVGHTSVAMAGAASVPRCLVVAHTMQYGEELVAQAKAAGADGITVISLSDSDGVMKLLGCKNTAIAFDNSALVELFGAALEEIDRQERRVNHLKRLISELAADAKDI